MKQTAAAALKPHLVKEGSFYKTLLTLALPVTLQNIVVFLTQMLDTVMLGELGEVAMSAAQLANQPFFVFNLLTFGLAGGAMVLCSQYWGMGKMEPIKSILTICIRFSMAVGGIVMLLIFFFPDWFMRLFTPDPAVIEAGVSYLQIICWSYLFFGFTNVYYTTIRSVGVVGIAMVSNVIALLVNAGLNYVLIFGKLGFQPMGVQGAAIATLIARVLEFVIAVCYMLVFDKKLRLRLREFFRFETSLLRDLAVVSAPVMANEVMWALGVSMQARLLGQLGTEAVAANSIVSVVQQLSTVAVFGAASAASVMVGQAIGEGNMQKARDRGFTFKLIAVLFGLVVSGIILLLRNVAVDFYNVTPETKELARQMLYAAALIGFFVSLSGISIVGIMRGGGDTNFCLILELAALWGVAVPLAYFAALVLKWPVPLVFLVMRIDEPLKSLVCFIRMRGTAWMRNVTR